MYGRKRIVCWYRFIINSSRSRTNLGGARTSSFRLQRDQVQSYDLHTKDHFSSTLRHTDNSKRHQQPQQEPGFDVNSEKSPVLDSRPNTREYPRATGSLRSGKILSRGPSDQATSVNKCDTAGTFVTLTPTSVLHHFLKHNSGAAVTGVSIHRATGPATD